MVRYERKCCNKRRIALSRGSHAINGKLFALAVAIVVWMPCPRVSGFLLSRFLRTRGFGEQFFTIFDERSSSYGTCNSSLGLLST